MHHRPYENKNCHSREGGNPRIYGGERKVQLIMFTYLLSYFRNQKRVYTHALISRYYAQFSAKND